MFTITNGKGFHVTFKNNWTVSVQFGAANYCEHHGTYFGTECGPSQDAEVGIWHEESIDGMQVIGYQSPEEVAAIMAEVATRSDQPQPRS